MIEPENMADALRAVATSQGVDFFGVADLVGARDAIVEQGGPALADYPRGVSIGMALVRGIVDQLSLEPGKVAVHSIDD